MRGDLHEVVVVGGGIAGAAVALELQGRGAAVNLVDASRPGSAATGASAGMLAPQYESAGPGALFELLRRSRACFGGFAARVAELAEQPVDLRWDGMLVANTTAGEHAESAALATWQTAAGEPAELLEPAEAVRLDPAIDPAVLSYLWLPREGQVDAQQLAAALGPALTRAGVRVINSALALGLDVRCGEVRGVELAGGRRLAADTVVIAAGAWSGALFGLPGRLPVRPVRGHLVRYAAGAGSPRCLVAAHAGRYLVPRNDGTVLAGSTMDDLGFDRSVDDAALEVVQAAAAALAPALATRPTLERWADLRPMPADGLPVVGDTEVKGLYLATGYGRNGILMAPLVAHLLAAHVVGGGAAPELEPFALARFSGGAAASDGRDGRMA